MQKNCKEKIYIFKIERIKKMIKNDNGMHLENYVENGVLCLELNLSDIMAVRCYTNDK